MGITLFSLVLIQDGEPMESIHLFLQGALRLYSLADQTIDAVVKGKIQAIRHFEMEPQAIKFPFRLTDVDWLI